MEMKKTIREDGKYFLVQYVAFSLLIAVLIGLPNTSPLLVVKIALMILIAAVANYLTWPLWKKFWIDFGTNRSRIGVSHVILNWGVMLISLLTGVPLGILVASVTGGAFA